MEGSTKVVWVDNFYKRRYGVNPTCTDHSLNSTAVAVLLNTRPLGGFRGYPTLKELHGRLPYVGHKLRAAHRDLIAFVRGSFCGVGPRAVRVPLDVPRGRVKGQQWRPLSLEPVTVWGDAGLLHIITLLRGVSEHCGGTTPVLVDENIHYRIMKWMYSATFRQVAIREHMPPLVWLYGVWHAYKFACLHTHRVFFPLFVYLDAGYVDEGSSVSCVQKLGWIERMVAAVWEAGSEMLSTIDTEIRRMEDWFGGVQTRARSNTRVAFEDQAQADAASERLYARRVAAGLAPYIPSKLWFLLQLRLLITDFCPALFGIGFHVRSCTWAGRDYGTSTHAKTALQWTLMVLLQLSPPDSKVLKYIRTVCTALITWTSWHDASPGQLHAEEACESMLSQVTHALRRHPTGTDHQHYSNVYLTATSRAGRRTPRRDAYVSVNTVQTVRSRIQAVIRGNRTPCGAAWHGRKPRTTHTTHVLAMVRDVGPHPFCQPRNVEDVIALLKDCLKTLVHGRQANSVFLNALCQVFGQRPEECQEEDRKAAEGIIAGQPARKRRRLPQ
jgi:hypothetical protein